MASALMIMVYLCVGLIVLEGIPKMWEAGRKRREWRRIRRACYPKMYY